MIDKNKNNNNNPWKENENNGKNRQNSNDEFIGMALAEAKNEKEKRENGDETEEEKGHPRDVTTWTEMIREWPKSTIYGASGSVDKIGAKVKDKFKALIKGGGGSDQISKKVIVLNEFCERFSFYGMRTVLTLYFLNVLNYNANSATMMFNGSTVLFYFMPIFGSILADGYLGKFKTIFFLSILYTIGQCVLCFASTRNGQSSLHPWLDIVGLVIIGFGTGGIKPCVCSFGGDQFKPYQQKMLSLFFSAFYFAINAGSMISTFISPMFRATPCLGQDSCYPLAFGVPAVLMVLATVLFTSASFWYTKRPPTENIFSEVYQVGKKAIVNKWHSKGSEKHGHWLDHYFDSHLCDSDPKCEAQRTRKGNPNECHKRRLVTDVQCLLRVLVVYLPAPVFWALYDQQGSRWLIQSVMMDCRLWGDTLLLPDQMLTLNSVLILLFIPMFQVVVYPIVSLFFRITPLRKMVVGGLVAALAFVLSAIVQFQINTTLPDTPMDGRAFVSTINAFDNCTLKVCAANGNGAENCRILEPNQTLTNTNRKKPEMFELDAGQQKWRIEGTGGGECGDRSFEGEVGQGISAGSTYWMMVSRMGVLFGETDTQKPTGAMGEFKVGITLALEDIEYGGNLALCRWRSENDEGTAICDPRRTADFVGWQVEDGDLMSKSAFEMPNDGRKSAHNATIYGYKTLFLMKERPKAIGQETMSKEQLNLTETGIVLEVGTQGGIYMVALTGSLSAVEKRIFHAVPDNSVSILWQIPQIMMITAAEVLFSITGYEFAYSQAPPSMKSLVQALWLMTTAIGDLIILLITLIAFPNEAIEFLFYAAGMVVVITILALLAIFYYEYNNYTTDTDTTRKFEEKNNEKKQPFKGGGGRKRSGRRIQIYGTTEEKSGTKKTEEKAEKII